MLAMKKSLQRGKEKAAASKLAEAKFFKSKTIGQLWEDTLFSRGKPKAAADKVDEDKDENDSNDHDDNDNDNDNDNDKLYSKPIMNADSFSIALLNGDMVYVLKDPLVDGNGGNNDTNNQNSTNPTTETKKRKDPKVRNLLSQSMAKLTRQADEANLRAERKKAALEGKKESRARKVRIFRLSFSNFSLPQGFFALLSRRSQSPVRLSRILPQTGGASGHLSGGRKK